MCSTALYFPSPKAVTKYYKAKGRHCSHGKATAAHEGDLPKHVVGASHLIQHRGSNPLCSTNPLVEKTRGFFHLVHLEFRAAHEADSRSKNKDRKVCLCVPIEPPMDINMWAVSLVA